MRGGLGVALALDLLRVAVGVGDDHLALAVGVGADLLALGGAGGAQLVGDALALGLHAAIDRLGDRLDVVDARDAHVDDVDAPRLGALREPRLALTSAISARAWSRAGRARCAWSISSWNALRTTRLSWLSRRRSSRPTLRMYCADR